MTVAIVQYNMTPTFHFGSVSVFNESHVQWE